MTHILTLIASDVPLSIAHLERLEKFVEERGIGEFDAWAANFAIGVATNGNVGTGVSDPLIDDSALEYVTNSLWNAFTWV